MYYNYEVCFWFPQTKRHPRKKEIRATATTCLIEKLGIGICCGFTGTGDGSGPSATGVVFVFTGTEDGSKSRLASTRGGYEKAK